MYLPGNQVRRIHCAQFPRSGAAQGIRYDLPNLEPGDRAYQAQTQRSTLYASIIHDLNILLCQQ